MHIEGIFDKPTNTISYIVLDTASGKCALVDSVLGYDPKSGRTDTASADRLIQRVKELDAKVEWILETHVHADHLTAAPYIREKLGGQTGIGDHISVVQEAFGRLFNAGSSFPRDGSQFDRLFCDGDSFRIGGLRVDVLHTPGHTPACVTYLVSDGKDRAALVGDTLFMPDTGTARCDFPGGNAQTLYRSIRRLLDLPADTRLYFCHDYPPADRPVCHSTTVAEERQKNIHVRDGIPEEQFVAMRKQRDASLEMPVLILPAVQVNMRGGRFPEPEANGVSYLKIPLNLL